MKTKEIIIRDPFVLPYKNEYYMYGSRVGEQTGFDVYKSTDIENWSEPKSVFEKHDGFWGTKDFWAPEVHLYNGKFYMFASFCSDTRRRGTQILVSDKPDGSFEEWSDVVTPNDWECLDGTLWVEDGVPYMVFCHEWIQIKDGEVCAVRLSADLKRSEGEPFVLWKASDAKWVVGFGEPDSGLNITDGPFLLKDKNGRLCSLWSSFCESGYALGKAYSDNGKISGKWINEEEPLFKKDGGHGMCFETFNGERLIALHINNSTAGKEHPVFIKAQDL